MAVVQISKIQVRRGKKNSNSGIPQLSSAELAWAIDTQELFIGNGSVADGAPYVGNTKILTEHDNLFELISSYQFAYSDTSITGTVPRKLQSKLDEYVSVADFGAVGDGSTDCVAAFETAMNRLFTNTNENYKKVLYIPNGEYLFNSDLRIPSGVILQGETQLGVTLNIGINNIRFITSSGLELVNFNATNRPQNIRISNLTVNRTTGQTVVSGLTKILFEDVVFRGEYNLGDSVPSLITENAAVFWQNDSFGIKVDDLRFRNCLFDSNSISVKCVQTAKFDTFVDFENCKFFRNHVGIFINGISEQGNNWNITDCSFQEISSQAFRSSAGRGTVINRTKFLNCGNETSLISAKDYIVYFGEKIGNILTDCSSDRQQNQTRGSGSIAVTSKAISEVYNSARVKFSDRIYAPIEPDNQFVDLTIFSAENKYFTINYFLQLGNHSRTGELTISIGDLSDNLAITDSYQYSPTFQSTGEGVLMTNFEFRAVLRDAVNSVGFDADSTIDTVVLQYKNPLPGAAGSISFDVTYGV